jgi:hypothetical protein
MLKELLQQLSDDELREPRCRILLLRIRACTNVPADVWDQWFHCRGVVPPSLAELAENVQVHGGTLSHRGRPGSGSGSGLISIDNSAVQSRVSSRVSTHITGGRNSNLNTARGPVALSPLLADEIPEGSESARN